MRNALLSLTISLFLGLGCSSMLDGSTDDPADPGSRPWDTPENDPGDTPTVDSTVPWDVVQDIASYYDSIDLNNYTNVIYIDPSTTLPAAEQNGSENAPFDSWEDVSITENSAYLQKRGTVFEYGRILEVSQKDNLLFWVYGEGEEKAVFKGKMSFSDLRNLIVADFEFDGTDDPDPWHPKIGIHYGKTVELDPLGEENLLFLGNYIHGTGTLSIQNWGDATIPACGPHGPIQNVRVIGNEIGPVYGDGMFIAPNADYDLPEDADNLFFNMEVGFNHVHGVNQEWFEFLDLVAEHGPYDCPITDVAYSVCPDSHQTAANGHNAGECISAGYVPFGCGGDAYQIASVSNFWFHDNIADRSTTGNKFGALFVSATSTLAEDVMIERNIFKGPSPEGSGGVGMYINRRGGSEITIRNNLFLPPHNRSLILEKIETDNVKIYGNAFSGGATGLNAFDFKNMEIFNNVFYKIEGRDIQFVSNGTDTGALFNNIFVYPEGGKSSSSISNRPTNSFVGGNNLFSSVYDGMFTSTGGVPTYAILPSDIIGDPDLADPENGDFHILPGSPAIDAGLATGLPIDMKDIDGEDMPNGEHPEIGIDEVE